MTQKMVCPPSPLGYTKYERRYYAGDWWYRVSPSSPWQLCVEDGDDDTSNDETDETLEYMCELLEAHEIEPDEFRRQMRNEGYNEEVIRLAIRDRRPDYTSLVD
ncbi:hypothetical protein ABIF26_008247 [Bradyrhizobium elkanii]|nr:hypothetical protein [Bradyrhizobium elkanii]